MKNKWLSILAVVGGASLLAVFVWATGPEKLWSHLTALGLGLVWVVLVYQAEVMLEVWAWQLAVPPHCRTGYWAMYCASVAGSSLNNVLPSGQAGEIVKGTLLAGLVPAGHIVSSLVVYNYLFNATTIGVVAAGAVGCAAFSGVPWDVSAALLGGAAVAVVLMLLFAVWIRRGAVRDVVALARGVPVVGRRIPERVVEQAQRIDTEIRSFRSDRPRDFRLGVALLVAARVLAILELWVILDCLGVTAGTWTATGLFCGTQLFYYVALFLPTRIGVLEGGSILVFRLFGLAGDVGLAAEFVRTIRKVIFMLAGVGLLAWLASLRRRRTGE